MRYDAVIVGAGPAGLACAIRLRQLDPERSICVLEKGASVGAHLLSGALLDPAPLDELWPAWRASPPEICVPIVRTDFKLLTQRRSLRLPTPPQQRNRAAPDRLGSINSWLEVAKQAGARSASMYFPALRSASRCTTRHGAVAGVTRKATWAGGAMAVTKARLHARRADPRADHDRRGRLPQKPGQAADRALCPLGARGANGHGLGFKELWQLPGGCTAGTGAAYDRLAFGFQATYGGGVVYHLRRRPASYVGCIVELDYR